MKRFLRSAGVGALLFGTTAACSLVGFDGFVGPGGDGGAGAEEQTIDGAPQTSTDAGNGRGEDASQPSNDASEVEDAPDPNVPPVFIDGGSYCSGGGATTSFCEDFDTADLTVRWIREGIFGKLTSYESKSTPNVFLLDAPPTSATGTFVSKITQSFETSSTNMVASFDFKPERVNETSSFFILAALEWTRATSKYSLRLVYSNGVIRLEESNLVPPPNNKDAYHPFFNVAMDRWTRITLDVIATGSTPSAQILLDGIAVGARESIQPTSNIDPRPSLILGAVFAGTPHTGWRLRYDDVTLDFR